MAPFTRNIEHRTTACHTTACQTTVHQRTTRAPTPNNVLVELTVDHNKPCMLCRRKDISETLYGQLYQLNEIIIHYYCILFSSRAVKNGLHHEGICGFLLKDIVSELERGAKKNCFYCKKKGATILCYKEKCQKEFHLPCGLKNGSMHLYSDKFSSSCRQHRTTVNVDLVKLKNTSVIQCVICMDDIMSTHSPISLWTSCCKRNIWFHRDCIQKLALSDGYFFKCSLCKNVEMFETKMLLQGIYIPSSNTSLESIPDSIAEPLKRHRTCNASTCLCPHQGKQNYNDEYGSWEIIMCQTCGSNGTHRLCNSIRCDQRWCCPVCQTYFTDKRNKPKRRQFELPTSSSSSNGISAIFEENCLFQRGEDPEIRMDITSCNNNSRAQSYNDTIIISDEDSSNDSSVMCITYIDPPSTKNLPVAQIPQMQLPIITNFESVDIIRNIDNLDGNNDN